MGQGIFFTRVFHSVHGGRGLCILSLSVWLAGPMFLPGVCVQGGLCPGDLCAGGSVSRGSLSRGSLSRRVSVWLSPQTKIPRTVKSGRMHPTGMLSCFNLMSTYFFGDKWTLLSPLRNCYSLFHFF